MPLHPPPGLAPPLTAFSAYVRGLAERKGVVVTGDLNCAHQEIDIHSPKTNLRSAGFTQVRRAAPGSAGMILLCEASAPWAKSAASGCLQAPATMTQIISPPAHRLGLPQRLASPVCPNLSGPQMVAQEERDSFAANLLGQGFIDAFRRQYPGAARVLMENTPPGQLACERWRWHGHSSAQLPWDGGASSSVVP